MEQTKLERTKMEQTKMGQTKLEQTKLEPTQLERTKWHRRVAPGGGHGSRRGRHRFCPGGATTDREEDVVNVALGVEH